MFSPPIKKPLRNSREDVSFEIDGNSTPLAQNRRPLLEGPSVSKRPATGTPAQWASRIYGVPRLLPAKRSDRGDDMGAYKPICVGELPQLVRDAQLISLQNRVLADAYSSGGMDEGTSLAWIIHGKRVFIWNYLSADGSRKCTVLDLPSPTFEYGDVSKSSFKTKKWVGCIVNWDSMKKTSFRGSQECRSAGLLLCSGKDGNLIFWPNIYSGGSSSTTDFFVSTELKTSNFGFVNSLIASAIPNFTHCCIAFACSSGDVLWKINCRPSGIECSRMPFLFYQGYEPMVSNNYPRSLIWHSFGKSDKTSRQFLLLTKNEIQCFEVKLSHDFPLMKLWSHEFIGNCSDLSIQMDLASHGGIYPLALDVDGDGKVISALIGMLCKDQVTGSNYTQYSLLTMQYKSGVDMDKSRGGNMLEKKKPIQVIIPKASMDGEEILFSMRLKVGGKPPGSAMLLSGDGTATISHYSRNSQLLYQLDLPNDAGKVLDASVFPLLESNEDGDWAVLTEKTGIWVIPEREVSFGRVVPPERSLSHKGSGNDISLGYERREYSVSGSNVPRRSSLEARDVGDKKILSPNGFPYQSSQDEESEALLSQLFNDFLVYGQVDSAFSKLRKSGAFDKEGELNTFSRTSKSIADTLAKHWTAARGPEILLSLLGTLLTEKQLKHQKFLQFLALSKCHEELCSKQRLSLQIILENGEKIAGIIQLKELQNMNSHPTTSERTSSDSSDTGALWNLVQLAGERSRRSSVLLMDRNNTEVFYTKVSDLEEFFLSLGRQLEYVISRDASILVQSKRACELANACVMILHGASQYRSEHHLWYPPPEGLTPWYAKTVVCHGLSSIASFMLQLLNATSLLDDSLHLELYSNLELLSEVLLESYSIAVTSKVERKEEYETLLDEYRKLRDTILQSLYEQVKKMAQARRPEPSEENQNKDLLMTLSSNILSIAKKHEAYQTMWSICNDLNDSELLHSLMLESVGPKGGFSCFVFEKLYESKQFSKLVRLGEDFHGELTSFLKLHPDLLWRHEVFLHQFSSASETLHGLSLSKDGTSPSAPEETDSSSRRMHLTFKKRKHLLNLAKIAVVAGRDVGYESKAKRIEADLNILRLQEEILKFMPDNENMPSKHNLLSPVDLIELCLETQNRELSLRVFDIFSSTTPSFIRNNVSLLEECWINAANQDDWSKLTSLTEECSEERSMEMLKETVLYQASCKCYGPDSESSYARIDEVMPLAREEISESGQSVESVVMKHIDYEYYGKLMLTAINLGSCYGSGFIQDRMNEEEEEDQNEYQGNY